MTFAAGGYKRSILESLEAVFVREALQGLQHGEGLGGGEGPGLLHRTLQQQLPIATRTQEHVAPGGEEEGRTHVWKLHPPNVLRYSLVPRLHFAIKSWGVEPGNEAIEIYVSLFHPTTVVSKNIIKLAV